MAADYRAEIRQAVLDEPAFVRLTVSAPQGDAVPWRRVVVRPVLLKGGRQLQFSHFTATQDITKNYGPTEAPARLDELLAMAFGSLRLEAASGNLQVQVSTSGKATLRRTAAATEAAGPALAHDRPKRLPFPADQPDPFLQGIGIMSSQGQVIAGLHDKLTQINEFIKLLEHAHILESPDSAPLRILDCGCGSSYLSLAVYYYLNTLRGIPATLVGLDTNPVVIEKSAARAAALGFEGARFEVAAIASYAPDQAPDLVLGLHACDTATDDTIAQGILHGARAIVCAPCCHHHLHGQIGAVEPYSAVLKHGILKQRWGDILTDALRARILEMAGYRADVVEFVAPEHTDRNLMIRAVKRDRPARGQASLQREYAALTTLWGVTPYLENLLRERERWPAAP